jgi:hypothetical protein
MISSSNIEVIQQVQHNGIIFRHLEFRLEKAAFGIFRSRFEGLRLFYTHSPMHAGKKEENLAGVATASMSPAFRFSRIS